MVLQEAGENWRIVSRVGEDGFFMDSINGWCSTVARPKVTSELR